jgi:multidrug efflux pump subunit AcrA (membrane-fusion protein)
MKFPLSRKWTVITGGFIVLLIIIGFFAFRGPAKEIYVTDSVKRANLVKTVDITGSLTPLSHVDLSFLSSGNVARIFTSVGDFVQAGETLASLSALDLSADARKAQADLELARAEAKPEDINSAQADISSAEVGVQNAETALEVTKSINVVNITNAEDALTKKQEDQTSTRENDVRTVVNALNTGVIQIRTGLSKADELLGIENTLFNDSFEREFSALDPQAKQSAKNAFDLARTDRNLAELAVISLSTASSDAELLSAITVTERALKETSDTLLYTRRGLDGTSADTVDLSLTELVAYKTSLDAARTSVDTARATLEAAGDTRAQNATTQAHAVTTAELAVRTATANAVKDEANAEANLKSAQATLEKARAAYEKLIAPPRSVDLAPYIANRDSASARYLKTEIVSPISGRVGKVDIRLGEAVTAGTGVIAVEPQEAAYDVTIDVPESDVALLALGDTAIITFDAFGSEVEFTGSLTSLDRSEKLIEGVIFYEARIAVTDGPRMNELRNGMSADVTISVESRTNALTVPTRAIIQANGKKIVRVLVNDKIVEQEIVAGLRGDSGTSEILSGLSEGDVVIVSIKK